jgi:hypothetical protein
MHDAILKPGWETVLAAVVFIGLLFLGFFRLDAVLGAPKKSGAPGRPPSGQDEDGRSEYSDPDGRPWKKRRRP